MENISLRIMFFIQIVATGCNRTQDRHSRENRPLKKGIQTGGK